MFLNQIQNTLGLFTVLPIFNVVTFPVSNILNNADQVLSTAIF